MERFIGFDEPDTNENFFELTKDKKQYLSLYHHCRVIRIAYPEDNGSFSVTLTKTYDSGFGPSVGTTVVLSCEAASIYAISATMDGNFEDFEEITCLEKEPILKIKMVISGVEFYVMCKRAVLAIDRETA